MENSNITEEDLMGLEDSLLELENDITLINHKIGFILKLIKNLYKHMILIDPDFEKKANSLLGE